MKSHENKYSSRKKWVEKRQKDAENFISLWIEKELDISQKECFLKKESLISCS